MVGKGERIKEKEHMKDGETVRGKHIMEKVEPAFRMTVLHVCSCELLVSTA
jgi:hypothetical protein